MQKNKKIVKPTCSPVGNESLQGDQTSHFSRHDGGTFPELIGGRPLDPGPPGMH